MAVDAGEFDPIPSWRSPADLVVVASAEEAPAGVLGLPIAAGETPPGPLGLGAAELTAAGFTGQVGQMLPVPGLGGGRPMVLFGTGPAGSLGPGALRDAAAALALATTAQAQLVIAVPESERVDAEAAAQALVEGVLMARYSFDAVRSEPADTHVASLSLVLPEDVRGDGERGARRGWWMARATRLSRDLANSPPSLLNAERLARCAQELGRQTGVGVEVFGQEALRQMGCGGLLGVNAGSVDEARMIKLTYRPSADGPPRGRLTLVGKGIMYDSGGISLKPADAVHATMKNDMTGAGAILAAMSVLAGLGCRTAVTGYLMCTDNMPSGSATKLGDVLWIRGSRTVEVVNTDAEGRLVMADALVLATEEPTDAIIDIATLTGACLRALGAEIAGVFGNAQGLVDQVLDASAEVDEPAWQLPLARRYRPELDSDVADIKNIGGPNGGAIHAALFLEDFVAGRPWAHIDIAGPAQNDRAASWRTKGCTGFGARLLARLALDFSPPESGGSAGSGTARRGVSEVSR